MEVCQQGVGGSIYCMVEVWWSCFYGQVLLLCTKGVGKGGVWNVSNCHWLYLYYRPGAEGRWPGAEGRYPGVVFFPLGGSVSWHPGTDVFCVNRVRCLLSVRCVRSPGCVCRWDWLRGVVIFRLVWRVKGGRSQYTWDRTYGRTVYTTSMKMLPPLQKSY